MKEEKWSLWIALISIAVYLISNIIRINIIEREVEDIKLDLYDLTNRIDSTNAANDTIKYFSTKTQHYETTE